MSGTAGLIFQYVCVTLILFFAVVYLIYYFRKRRGKIDAECNGCQLIDRCNRPPTDKNKCADKTFCTPKSSKSDI